MGPAFTIHVAFDAAGFQSGAAAVQSSAGSAGQALDDLSGRFQALAQTVAQAMSEVSSALAPVASSLEELAGMVSTSTEGAAGSFEGMSAAVDLVAEAVANMGAGLELGAEAETALAAAADLATESLVAQGAAVELVAEALAVLNGLASGGGGGVAASAELAAEAMAQLGAAAELVAEAQAAVEGTAMAAAEALIEEGAAAELVVAALVEKGAAAELAAGAQAAVVASAQAAAAAMGIEAAVAAAVAAALAAAAAASAAAAAAATAAAAASAAAMAATAAAAAAAAKSVGSSASSMQTSFGGLKTGLGGLMALFAAKWVITGMVDANLEIMRVRQSLEYATGSVQGMRDSWDFLDAVTNRLGTNLRASAVNFGLLTAAAKGTTLEGQRTRDVFVALSETGTVLDLSAEKMDRAMYVVQNMISKGTVSAVELRRELGTAIPGAMELAAKTIQKPGESLESAMQRFNAEMRKGEIQAGQFLPAFAKQLHEAFGPDVDKAAQNSLSQLNRLKNAFFEMEGVISDQFMPALAAMAKAMAAAARSDDFQAFAHDLGQAIAGIIEGLHSLGSFLYDHGIRWHVLRSVIADATGDILTLVANMHQGMVKILDSIISEFQAMARGLANLVEAHPLLFPGAAEAAAQLRGVADAAGDVGKFVHDASDATEQSLRDLAQGYHEVADEQLDLQAGSDAAAASLKKVADSSFHGVAGADAETKANEKLEKKFAEMKAELERHIADQKRVADAYGVSVQAGEQMERQLGAIERALAKAKDMTGSMKATILDLATAAEKWDATVAGDKSLAGLKQEAADLQKINSVYGQGSVAIAQANRDLERETLLRENLTKVTADQTGKLKELVEQLLDDRATRKFQDAAEALTEENAALAKLNDSYRYGHDAVLKAKDDLDLEGKLRTGLVGLLGKQRDAMAALIIVGDTLSKDNNAKQALQDLRDQVDVDTKLAAIHNLDYDTQRHYQQALAAVNDQLEAKKILDSSLAKASKEQIDDLTKLIAKKRELKNSIQEEGDARKKRDEAIKAWEGLAQTISDAFGSMNSSVVKLIQGAKSLADSLVQVAAATSKIGAAQAGAGFGSTLGGFLQTGGPSGGVGGAGEGNFAQLGGAILGAIGSYWGPIGTVIGSVVGSLIGSAIKKGGDEALGTISFINDKIATAVTESEHGLGMTITALGGDLASGINKIVSALGGVINSLPSIDVKIRDGTIRLIVGTVTGYFTSVQDAVQFAVEQELKQGNISGLSEEIRTVLKNTTATTLDDLASDLDFGKWVQQLNLPAVTVALQDLAGQFLAAKHRAEELGLSTEKLTTWYANQLQAQRNTVLGLQQDPAAQLRQNVAAFNAEVALERADAEQKLLDLQSKKAYLDGQMQYVKATGHIYEAELGIQEGFLGASVAIARTGGSVLGVLATSLDAVNKAIDDELAILQALPALISDKDLQDALNRLKKAGAGGGRSGSDRQSQVDTFNNDVKTMMQDGMDPFLKGLADLHDKLAKLDATAKQLGLSEADVAAARQHEIDLMKQQVADQLKPYLPQSLGGQAGETDFQKNLSDLQAKFAQIEKDNQALIDQTGQRAAGLWKIRKAEIEAERQLVEGVISGLNLPMEQTAAQGKAVVDALDAMRTGFMDGALSAQRYNEVLGEIQSQSAATLEGMAQNLLTAEGNTLGAAQMKDALDKANFELQLAQLNVLYETLLAAGALAPDVAADVKKALDYLNDPAHAPIFNSGDEALALQRRYAQNQAQAASEYQQWLQDQATKKADLLKTLNGYIESGWDPLVKQLYDLNQAFVDIRASAAALGVSVTQVDAAYQAAVQDFWNKALGPLKQLQQSLLQGADSPLTAGQKFAADQGTYQADLARLRSGDLSAVSVLPADIQAYIADARAVLPTASAAYVQLFNSLQSDINGILASGGIQGADLSALYALLGQTPPPGTPGVGQGPAAAPDVIAATQQGSADIVNELRVNAITEQDWLRQIAQHTNDAQTGIYQVYNRLNQPLITTTR